MLVSTTSLVLYRVSSEAYNKLNKNTDQYKMCIRDRGEEGWALHPDIMDAISETEAEVMDLCRKDTFGSIELCELLKQKYEGKDAEIEFIGLFTDICVISNALMVKAALPEAKLIVHADLCAGVTKESHDNALSAMKMCQVDIQF